VEFVGLIMSCVLLNRSAGVFWTGKGENSLRISIVTTTFNAMPYIVDTARSVLQSSYPDLEYVIIDAGSSDGTLEYLRGIQDSRVRLEIMKGSRPYEAVDWGFRHSTGDVLAWLNGDDLYYPGTISCVAKLFTEFPDVEWITGLPSFVDAEGRCTMVAVLSSYPRRYIENGWFTECTLGSLIQESMFWRRGLYESAGGLNLDYDLAADFELWTRFARRAPLVAVSTLLAAWRKHGTNRGLIGASAYLDDVKRATADLPRMNLFKTWLCRRMVTRQALRLAEWHRTPWIYFSMTESRWKRGAAFRPLTRYGLQHLLMEFLAKRKQTRLVNTAQ
jgi:glycosyltransferase involved in cell wall biosynthesis